jgi:hypothetical protein
LEEFRSGRCVSIGVEDPRYLGRLEEHPSHFLFEELPAHHYVCQQFIIGWTGLVAGYPSSLENLESALSEEHNDESFFISVLLSPPPLEVIDLSERELLG